MRWHYKFILRQRINRSDLICYKIKLTRLNLATKFRLFSPLVFLIAGIILTVKENMSQTLVYLISIITRFKDCTSKKIYRKGSKTMFNDCFCNSCVHQITIKNFWDLKLRRFEEINPRPLKGGVANPLPLWFFPDNSFGQPKIAKRLNVIY